MRKLGIVAVLLAVVFLLPSPALAQVKGVYWTNSGMFGPFPLNGLVPSLPPEKSRDVTIPINMWVIDHAKGEQPNPFGAFTRSAILLSTEARPWG